MPYVRPDLAALIERAAADIEAELPGVDARLRRSNLSVLARVHAASVHGLYGYLSWMADQLMVDTCEAAYLDRYAGIWGVVRRAADFATGPVTLAGTSGVTVPAGTAMQRSDGARYALLGDVLLAGGSGSGTGTGTVVADEAGATGNAAAGAALALVVPQAGVTPQVVVASAGLTAGVDAEADAALRERLLQRIRQTPMGGAAWDYTAWALEVPGVTRAWVYPLEAGPGTVVVRFVRDDDASLIPDAAEVAAVQAYIDERRPVCAAVTVLAPVATPLALQITLTPNTLAVKDAVQAELRDLLRREARPGGTILVSHLREAISVAAGETNHVLNSPTADVVYVPGQIAVLGTITWS